MGSIHHTMEQSDSLLQTIDQSDSILHTMKQSDTTVQTMEQSDRKKHTMEQRQVQNTEQSDRIIQTKEQTQPSNKRVTWDINLYEIRMISPREEKKVFPLPTSHKEDTCNHQIYQITQPSEVKTQSGLFLSKFYLAKTNKSQLIPG